MRVTVASTIHTGPTPTRTPHSADFDDEGFSGGNVERPALERLFARIRAGDVDRVIVYRLDRLTRRLADWALLARLFDHFGVGLTVVSGMLDVEGGSLARLQLDVLAIFAELERDMIGERPPKCRFCRQRWQVPAQSWQACGQALSGTDA